jgi:hypothetical protein
MGVLYEAAYEKFSKKYGISHNIYNEYAGIKTINRLEDNIFESTPEKKQVDEKKAYLSTLQSVLTTYLQKKTKYEADKSYDMSDVSLGEFIDEFDNVMNAIYADAGEEHIPYSGLTINQVSGETWRRIESFNKPLHKIWGKQIRNGTLSIEQLQVDTSNSIYKLDNLRGNYANSADKDLAKVIMAKNAMEAAKKERSWLWWLNPRNWGPYGRENDYLKELKAKIKSYEEAGFPVDSVVPESYSTNILEQAHQGLVSYVQTKAAEEAKINEVAKNAKKIDFEAKFDERSKDAELREKCEAQIGDVLKSVKNMTTSADNTFAFVVARTEVEKLCKKMDLAQQKPPREGAKMINDSMKNFFKAAYTVMGNKTGPVDTKAVIGAQKIIDLMINAYAPDVSKSEIYAKYGDNFFMNNEAPFKSALAIIDSTIVDDKSFNTFMEDVKNELEKQNLNANKEPEIENKENNSKDIELNPDKNEIKAENIEVKAGNIEVKPVEYEIKPDENEIKAEDIDRHVEDLLKVSLDTSLDLDGANIELGDDALASEDNLFELDNGYDINGESFELDNEDNPLADVNFQEEPQVEIPELDDDGLEKIKLQIDKRVTKKNKPESRRTDGIKATSRINAKNLLKTSKDKVLEDFVDTLVAADMDENNKMIMCKSLYTDLILKMDNTWMHPEKMGDYANTIFTSVYNKINTDVSEMTIGDKLVATQEIIDIAFNSFTPVATDPKLARYGDNYCMRYMDAEDIQKLTGYKGDVDELMNNVKVGLGIIKEKKEEKEHVEFLNGEFKEEVGDKAQKIEEIKAPSHSKSIE